MWQASAACGDNMYFHIMLTVGRQSERVYCSSLVTAYKRITCELQTQLMNIPELKAFNWTVDTCWWQESKPETNR